MIDSNRIISDGRGNSSISVERHKTVENQLHIYSTLDSTFQRKEIIINVAVAPEQLNMCPNVPVNRDVSTLKFIHTNCQSAMNKRDEVLELIHKHRPDVLALTEFGAGEEVQNGEINITGYTLYRKDHSDGKGGPGRGTVMYIS